MFELFKNDPAEFGVITASFYGLRRSEIVGLKWDAIDFERKTITIRHTVTEVTLEGKTELIISDSTKTQSSYRTLPLVAPFEKILLQMKQEQEQNKRLCGKSYCQDYLDYIYVNELGELMKPGYLTAHFPKVLEKNHMPKLRFHDLRHPYVKHTTKKFNSEKQKTQATKIVDWPLRKFCVSDFRQKQEYHM